MNETAAKIVELREDPNWLFAVRMDGKHQIEWVENIVECFAAFRRPIDAIAWDKLLNSGAISASTPEQNNMLRQWWKEGWKNTPIAAKKPGVNVPVLRLRETMSGWEPDILYPSLGSAAKDNNTTVENLGILNNGVRTKLTSPYKFIFYRETQRGDIEARKEKELPWTLFGADNIIQGHYRTKKELAAAVGATDKILDLVHKDHWNKLPDGRWIWHDEWDIMPISPNDEPLGVHWRETQKPTAFVNSRQLYNQT